MAQKTRAQLQAENAALFVENTTGDITPTLEKAYNEDVNDSFALLAELAFVKDTESQPNTISSVATAFTTGTGAIRNFIAPFGNVDVGDNFTDNYVGVSATVTKQSDGNGINGNKFGEVSNTTMGNGCNQNEIGPGSSVAFGDAAQNNVIGAGSNSFTFGNNLQNVFVMPGTIGKDVTASPDYDFLYNNAFPSRIYHDTIGNLYHETCVAGVLTLTLIP